MRHSVWRLPSIAAVVLAIFSLSAAAQTCVVPNPDMQSGDKVNLRAQPTTQSRMTKRNWIFWANKGTGCTFGVYMVAAMWRDIFIKAKAICCIAIL